MGAKSDSYGSVGGALGLIWNSLDAPRTPTNVLFGYASAPHTFSLSPYSPLVELILLLLSGPRWLTTSITTTTSNITYEARDRVVRKAEWDGVARGWRSAPSCTFFVHCTSTLTLPASARLFWVF